MVILIITYRRSNALGQRNALEVHNFVATFDGEQLKDLDLRTDLLHTDLQTYPAILRTYLFVFSFLLILFVDLQILLIYVILSWNDAHDVVRLIFSECDGTPINVYCQQCDLKLFNEYEK